MKLKFKLKRYFLGESKQNFVSKILFSYFLVAIVGISRVSGVEVSPSEANKATLISERLGFADKSFRLGLLINAPTGSHIYGKYPGEIGIPLSVDWRLPKGFLLKSVFWPAPQVFQEGFVFSGYENSVFLIAEILPSLDVREGKDYRFEASVEWLACKEDCYRGNASVFCDLSYSKSMAEKINPIGKSLFTDTLRRAPIIPEPGDTEVSYGDSLNLTVRLKGLGSNRLKKINEVVFISGFKEQDYSKAAVIRQTIPDLLFEVPLSERLSTGAQKCEGIVFLKDESGRDIGAVAVNVDLMDSSLPGNKKFNLRWTVFLMAFIGGILLNVMPCVLPMVTFKVYEIIKSSHRSRRQTVRQGILFAAGIVGCFWVLAGVAYVLKRLGHNVGWGFQLQEPVFVGFVALIFFTFGLSSLGVFEFGTSLLALGGKSSKGHSSWGAVFNGALTTLITTPCTGPLLGSVLGLSMSLSGLHRMGIFSAIGLGMASPYLLLVFFPTLTEIFPKPGHWMVLFKQLMGFIMLGTALWLLWIFGVETNVSALIVLLVALLIVGFAVWILGKWGVPSVKRLKRRLTYLVVVLLLFLGGMLTFKAAFWDRDLLKVPESSSEFAFASDFSLDKLARARRLHKGVFVEFTAKWCLTCQINKPVLYSQRFFDFCQAQDIVMMSADWTKKNSEITEELLRLGRASVPLYVFYSSDQNIPPKILPQTFSGSSLQQGILDALETSKIS